MWRVRTALLVSILVLPLTGLSAGAAPQDAPPRPVFDNGEAQPVFDPAQAIRENLFVTAPVDSDHDGRDDRVHVQVVRPKATEQGLRVPVVYRASPYFAGGNEVSNHNVDRELYVPQRPGHSRTHGTEGPGRRGTGLRPTVAEAGAAEITWAYEQYLLARGYAVVYAESLGSGQSTGCPTTGGRNETIGAKSVVDWLNSRAPARGPEGNPVSADWATGEVGMMGVSYNGTLPNAVATTGVEGLETIVPIGAISNWYDYYRADGAVVAPGGYQGEDADVLAKFVHTNDRACQDEIDRLTADQDRLTGDGSAFWDERNYLDEVESVRASVLVVHGLDDWNVKTKQAAQWYEALRKSGVDHKIWWHRSGHRDPITVRRDAWLQTLNRWFTHYLYGVDNGVEQEPRATIQREDGSWTREAEWPAPRARQLALQPKPGGDRRGGLAMPRGRNGKAVEMLRDDVGERAEDLAAAPSSPHRLAYFTEPTPQPVRVSGTVHADLALTFDRRAANVTAMLVDLAPDGTTTPITRGWTDPQNRHSTDRTSPIRPGKEYRIEVAMMPDDYVLRADHRLGLVVLSSDHDFTLRPDPGTGLWLDLSSSRLRVPVVVPSGQWRPRPFTG
ncbi:X-Pro dipeptidyl-peptidase [Halopolyspora algeriensis]|uniref:Xaa-Pro dipeptidyl-peptidase n=1 Tax=Halopolyspora algeriensis TaxID=1500506 RepID=A0A368VQS6_9ACTN|nr:Xaa-Pro dipeptidyl-peptidase [Halopolyspora algeriensis]RCW44010.1 X-Pro dipeptidyl-peptidase [Halopolyspora algeriensis]TQM53487.1 X-Pro dipeptidyl-peptidase [Halopolyspora algeriensis]